MKIKLIHAICILSLLFGGCASTTSSKDWDEKFNQIGIYPPPPNGLIKKRIGVIDFEDKTGSGKLAQAAPDQMTVLLFKTNRFDVVNRNRLKDILREQSLEGIVRPDQIPHAGEVLGLELICFGSVNDFEIKRSGTGFSVGFTGGGIGGRSQRLHTGDVDFRDEELEFNIGVDIQIADSTTAQIIATDSGYVKRVETARGMGLSLDGISIAADGQIKVDSANQGRLLRLALDEALRKMLPQIDGRFVTSK